VSAKNVVVWAGPVYLQQVDGAWIPGSAVYNWQCKGDQTPPCRVQAESLKTSDGRHLPALLSHFHEPVELGTRVFLAAFSAGGSFIRTMAKHPSDRAMIRAMHFADATYTSYDGAGNVRPNPDMVDLVKHFAESPSQLLVATSSSRPDRNNPSATQTLQATRAAVEQALGKTFEKLDHFYGVEPAPVAVYRLGNVILAEYGDDPLGHGGHATMIGRQVWDKIISPWDLGTLTPIGPKPKPLPKPLPLPGQTPAPVPEEPNRTLPVLVFLGAAVASAVGAYALHRRFRG